MSPMMETEKKLYEGAVKRKYFLSFAKTRPPLVLTTWEMGCNVVELGYMRPRRGLLESDDILAKDTPVIMELGQSTSI